MAMIAADALHGVFDTAKVIFSIVPGEGFDSFAAEWNLDLSEAAVPAE